MAEILASKIKNWIENGKIIQAKNRAANYGDIMILLRRRHNKFSKYLTKALQKYQVPFNTIAKIKFSESLLAQDLIAAAKFALLKEDDLNLAKKHNLPFVQHVEINGTIKSEVTDFAGRQAKPKNDPTETDVEIIKWLAHHDKLFAKEKIFS